MSYQKIKKNTIENKKKRDNLIKSDSNSNSMLTFENLKHVLLCDFNTSEEEFDQKPNELNEKLRKEDIEDRNNLIRMIVKLWKERLELKEKLKSKEKIKRKC